MSSEEHARGCMQRKTASVVRRSFFSVHYYFCFFFETNNKYNKETPLTHTHTRTHFLPPSLAHRRRSRRTCNASHRHALPFLCLSDHHPSVILVVLVFMRCNDLHRWRRSRDSVTAVTASSFFWRSWWEVFTRHSPRGLFHRRVSRTAKLIALEGLHEQLRRTELLLQTSLGGRESG